MNAFSAATCGLIAVAVFGTMLWVGAPTPSHAAGRAGRPRLFSPEEMPQYPGSFEVPLGEDLSLNGTPVRISTFVTDEPPERVARFFREGLRGHAHGPEEEWSADGCVLTLSTPMGGPTRSIVVRREGTHTRVFASLIPFSAAPVRLFPAPTGEVPYGPGSVAAMEVSEGGRPRRGRVAIFHETASRDAVRERVHAWMLAHQWTPLRPYDASDQMEFERGIERAKVQMRTVSSPANPVTSVVFQAADEHD
jgi:hypothetical protein